MAPASERPKKTAAPGEEGWSAVLADCEKMARQALAFRPRPGRSRPEVGLLYHFLKTADASLGASSDPANPEHAAYPCRYGNWVLAQERAARAIEGALHRLPEVLLLLRGVDVASTELLVPTWPILPILHRLRHASEMAAHALATRRPEWEVGPFGVTLHAGEDYRRTVEGVRRIHEPLEFGLLRPGDRLGHALALGDLPNRFGVGHRTTQPAEERLDDLLWELDRYGCGDWAAPPGRAELAQDEALRLARSVYGEVPALDVTALVEARRRRHNPTRLEALGFPRLRESAPTEPADRLLWLHLTAPEVYQRGKRLIEVVLTAEEVATVYAAQSFLRTLLGRWEITVEANPSSNLLIGNHPRPDALPAFRLQPATESSNGSPVLLSLNSDDPLTFATRLADEYAYTFAALRQQGLGADAALRWLDRVRENGYRSRFTLPASADDQVLRAMRESLGVPPGREPPPEDSLPDQ